MNDSENNIGERIKDMANIFYIFAVIISVIELIAAVIYAAKIESVWLAVAGLLVPIVNIFVAKFINLLAIGFGDLVTTNRMIATGKSDLGSAPTTQNASQTAFRSEFKPDPTSTDTRITADGNGESDDNDSGSLWLILGSVILVVIAIILVAVMIGK